MILSWAQLLIGLWLVVSPWLLGYASITVMKWSNTIVGIALVVINMWIIYGSKVGKSSERASA